MQMINADEKTTKFCGIVISLSEYLILYLV